VVAYYLFFSNKKSKTIILFYFSFCFQIENKNKTLMIQKKKKKFECECLFSYLLPLWLFFFSKNRRANEIWIALFSFQIHTLITKKFEPESPIKSVVVTSNLNLNVKYHPPSRCFPPPSIQLLRLFFFY
jgi:hypothetical protein